MNLEYIGTVSLALDLLFHFISCIHNQIQKNKMFSHVLTPKCRVANPSGISSEQPLKLLHHLQW